MEDHRVLPESIVVGLMLDWEQEQAPSKSYVLRQHYCSESEASMTDSNRFHTQFSSEEHRDVDEDRTANAGLTGMVVRGKHMRTATDIRHHDGLILSHECKRPGLVSMHIALEVKYALISSHGHSTSSMSPVVCHALRTQKCTRSSRAVLSPAVRNDDDGDGRAPLLHLNHPVQERYLP
jgi:hypothetical protein